MKLRRLVALLFILGGSTMQAACFLDWFFPSIEFYLHSTLEEHDDLYGTSYFTDPNRGYYGEVVETNYAGGMWASGTTNGNGDATEYNKSTPARWNFIETNGACTSWTVFNDRVVNKGRVPLPCRVYTGYGHSQYTPFAFGADTGDYKNEWVSNPSSLGTNSRSGGQGMELNDVLRSSNGNYTLTFLNDGNLVLQYQGVQTYWQSGTAGWGAHLQMGSDGNLIMYAGNWDPVWETGTSGFPGSYLILQDDGNLVIYKPNGQPLWWCGC